MESKQTSIHLQFMEESKQATSSLVDSDGGLECPACGGDYTHAQRVYTLCSPTADEASDILEFGCPFGGYDTGKYRRSAVVILFSCESCPQPFELIFQQHKGVTVIETRIPKTSESSVLG
jgi:hypothetical protein